MSKQVLYGKDAIDAAIKKGNINIQSSIQMEVLDLTAESREAQLAHEETLKKFEIKKRARSVIVPTATDEIKAKLRELGHPVTLFGEGPADRRERLREVIASMNLNDEELIRIQDMINRNTSATPLTTTSTSHPLIPLTTTTTDITKISQKDVFYSPATDTLINIRKYISEYSFTKTHERLLYAQKLRDNDEIIINNNKYVSELYKNSRNIILNSSQFGDDRPLSCIKYAPYGNIFATGSLNTTVKIWDISDLTHLNTVRGHEDRITSIAWHPQAFNTTTNNTSNIANNSVSNMYNDNIYGLFASTSAGNTCNLYKCELSSTNHTTPENSSMPEKSSENRVSSTNTKKSVEHQLIGQFIGHQGGISACAFHPCGRFIGTAGYDYTWRLYDIEYNNTTTSHNNITNSSNSNSSSNEVLLQDGHSKEVSGLSFSPDGSLVATSDYAGIVCGVYCLYYYVCILCVCARILYTM